jgi:hypothetical protein
MEGCHSASGRHGGVLNKRGGSDDGPGDGEVRTRRLEARCLNEGSEGTGDLDSALELCADTGEEAALEESKEARRGQAGCEPCGLLRESSGGGPGVWREV